MSDQRDHASVDRVPARRRLISLAAAGVPVTAVSAFAISTPFFSTEIATATGIGVGIAGTLASVWGPWRQPRRGASSDLVAVTAPSEFFLGLRFDVAAAARHITDRCSGHVTINALPSSDPTRWDLQVSLRNGRELQLRLRRNSMHETRSALRVDARHSYPLMLQCNMLGQSARTLRTVATGFAETLVDTVACPLMHVDPSGCIASMYRPGFVPRVFPPGRIRPRPEHRRDWDFFIPDDGGLLTPG